MCVDSFAGHEPPVQSDVNVESSVVGPEHRSPSSGTPEDEEIQDEDDIIAQIKKEKLATKNTVSTDMSKALELKIEEALMRDTGAEEESPTDGVDEEISILKKFESLSDMTDVMEERPSRSRPGKIFSGSLQMRVVLPKMNLKDFAGKHYRRKKTRRIILNQPEVNLVRLTAYELVKYGCTSGNDETFLVAPSLGNVLKRPRTPEEEKMIPIKKRKMVIVNSDDGEVPSLTESSKPYITRLLEGGNKEKKKNVLQVRVLFFRAKNLLVHIHNGLFGQTFLTHIHKHKNHFSHRHS